MTPNDIPPSSLPRPQAHLYLLASPLSVPQAHYSAYPKGTQLLPAPSLVLLVFASASPPATSPNAES